MNWAREILVRRWIPIVKLFRNWVNVRTHTEIIQNRARVHVEYDYTLPDLQGMWCIIAPQSNLHRFGLDHMHWERDREVVAEAENRVWPLGRRWGDVGSQDTGEQVRHDRS